MSRRVAEPANEETIDGETITYSALFDERLQNYLTAIFVVTCIVTGVLIPFLLLLPCVVYSIRKTRESMRLVLTDKTVIYEHGHFGCCCMCWNTESRHIPLEKVTDITYQRGCLEAQFGISTLTIETAGQGANITVQGVANTEEFRKVVMRAKARFVGQIYGGGNVATGAGAGVGAAAGGSAVVAPPSSAALLTSAEAEEALLSVKDTMLRLEARIQNVQTSCAAARASSSQV